MAPSIWLQALAVFIVMSGIEAHQARRCTDAQAAWMTSCTGPISAMRPAYITATRSQVSAITPMSCVMSMTAAPRSLQTLFKQLK